jgi:hypothetical protein
MKYLNRDDTVSQNSSAHIKTFNSSSLSTYPCGSQGEVASVTEYSHGSSLLKPGFLIAIKINERHSLTNCRP